MNEKSDIYFFKPVKIKNMTRSCMVRKNIPGRACKHGWLIVLSISSFPRVNLAIWTNFVLRAILPGSVSSTGFEISRKNRYQA